MDGENGGAVRGRVAFPFPGTSDFPSFLVQAQASGAKVPGLASIGTDTVNSTVQAYEFGLHRSSMRIAATLTFISDVHALGLETAQGLTLSNACCWDLNDRTRAFNRVKAKTPDKRRTAAPPSRA